MDWDLFTIIVGVVSVSCTRMWIKHRERAMELNAIARPNAYQHSDAALGALQAELSRLRDTTTQYDLSVERNMQEIMQRLQAVEAKTAAYSPAQAAAPSEPLAAPGPRASTLAQPMAVLPEEKPLRIQTGA